MTQLLNQAGLVSNDIQDDEDRSYAFGSCQIAGKEGISLAFIEFDGEYYGYIMCGYADEMKKSLDIDGATSNALSALNGLTASATNSTSSTDEEDEDDEDYADDSDYPYSSSSSDSNGYSYGNSSSNSSLAVHGGTLNTVTQ